MQTRTSAGQIFPYPANGDLVEENPPYFCWLREPETNEYRVEVADSSGDIVWQAVTDRNYIVPERAFPAGRYRWNLWCGDNERGWYDFTIADNAVEFIRPRAREVFEKVPANIHPRHLFYKSDIAAMLDEKSAELETLRRNISLALSRPLPEPPKYHKDKNAVEYREYFGAYRDWCDRDMVACALGWAILDDRAAGEKARELLLTICDWNPLGPTSLVYPWNDEIGLSNARCLPSVYDLIYDLLTEQQRYLVEKTIEAYASQCEERLTKLDFPQNPGNSHSGRIPAYLGEAAMILKGSKYINQEMLVRWLELALDIYGSIFPFYGTPDGGWAEGVFYATSYTRWYIPFFMAVERFAGVRYLDRPFYQRVIHYFMHFAPPERENHPFCDGYWCNSDDEEWPGFFAQNPYRFYAERFGPAHALELSHKYAAPQIFKLHLLDIFIPAGKVPKSHLTGEPSAIGNFAKAGFVSCQTNVSDQSDNTALLIRASRYGSASHQHADQGSFALIENNVTLITPSGYFGRAYGTRHHREWTRTTQAHNCVLVDGVGQLPSSHTDVGVFTECRRGDDGVFHVAVDLSQAYPMLRGYTRKFEFDGRELLIIDDIESDKPCKISWLLHTLSRPILTGDGRLKLSHKGQGFLLTPSDRFISVDITDQFAVDVNDGVADNVSVSLPKQYHVSYETSESRKHKIRVLIELM